MVFIGLQRMTTDDEEFRAFWSGSYATAVGLLEHFKNQLVVDRISRDTIAGVILSDEDDLDEGDFNDG